MGRPVRFEIRASDAQLVDLYGRLQNTRWPDRELVDDWSQGTPLGYLQDVVSYWKDSYDWRTREKALNELVQWRANAEGFGLHFVHMRSPYKDALPLLLSHGWPGSIVEFAKVIPRLLDPVAFGGHADDAFHIVAPSLPGFGFSDKPKNTGLGVQSIASMFDELMTGLGYERYVAQGGDWGSVITTCIGAQNRGACVAIHTNMPLGWPQPEDMNDPDPDAHDGLAAWQAYNEWDAGYSKQQSTRPQSVGYGLADSPTGQAAWILEKFWRWTDCDGHPENVLTRDELLDNVMLYWLPNNATSSARIYWESFGKPILNETGPVTLPTGCSLFPKEIFRPTLKWAERSYSNIIYWEKQTKGGHFAAFEQPGIFVDEMRRFFKQFR